MVDHFSSQTITFTWTQPLSNRNNFDSEISYNLSSNCGSCPNTTTNTTVTCTDVPTDGGVCTFTVRTVVCGIIVGSLYGAFEVAKDSKNTASCFGLIVSTSVLAGALVLLTCICIILVVVITKIRVKKTERCVTDRDYEVVTPQQASPETIDTKKNVAYGNIQGTS